MDTSDSDIEFDEKGICNHCHEYDSISRRFTLSTDKAKMRFHEQLNRIKEDGKGRRFDCILGVSGGIDSSYLAYLAMENGLRPLLVHMDNGWDSELAVKNIENIINKTGFEYYNYVVDWEEFKDLQLAYLRASVIDVEVVTDHAISAVLYSEANRRRIRYILSGANYTTEIIMPKRGWNFPKKNDLANLRSIHKRYGEKRLNTYPTLGLVKLRFYQKIKNIESVDLLNYVPYEIKKVKEILKREFGWREYPGKHHESIFTKFYQAYILPEKFNVDKRKAHLSNLICSGQLARNEAIEIINKKPYSETELNEEYEYVTKKLGLTKNEFEEIMRLPIVSHLDFPVERMPLYFKIILSVNDLIKRLNRVWKSASVFTGSSAMEKKRTYQTRVEPKA